MRVIGLTAPVQTGKIQLTHVFKNHGYRFVDLNDFIYDDRRAGSAKYDYYQRRWPGCLDEEGVETGRFYQTLDRATFQDLLNADMAMVTLHTLEEIEKARREGVDVVLSWEYLARISQHLSIDQLLIFQSDNTIWLDRLKKRATELGWSTIPTDDQLWAIIDMLDVRPETINQECIRTFSPKQISRIDVSPDDWGACNLATLLRSL
ncbi:MAG: hypothetical protein K8Q97_01850 [Candidatus Andersenbacteria bacterium]|nr:hypothetical protein [Candidatus Andersenbacteria bacterium]